MTRDDETILVIGGSSGTGRAIVELLHRRGERTRVLSRNPAAAASRLPAGVDVRAGDLTKSDTIAAAVGGAAHIILTAGLYSGYPATNATAKAIEFDGVLNVLAAVRVTGFAGRFLYMTASGVRSRSLSARGLNLWKGHTLTWRWRAEEAIRASGVDYSILRAGFLMNRPAGWRALDITQEERPLSLSTRLARADLAQVFVAALRHPSASHATFEVVGTNGPPHSEWDALLRKLRPDNVRT